MVSTPVRHIRIDNELWELATTKAARRRETVASVIRRALLQYIEDVVVEERWACAPPPMGSTYRVLRDEWSADFAVRTILEIEPVPVSVSTTQENT